MQESDYFVSKSAAMGVELSLSQATTLSRLLDELARWNQAYNLTALQSRGEWLTHHVLDSLSIAPLLHGRKIADVGAGAGFPGLPLAIAQPDREFVLIDSIGKKIRFIEHAARTLGLTNVQARHSRAENLVAQSPYDTIVARALAALPQLTGVVRGLCGPETRVLAMKGRRPDAEIAGLDSARWCVAAVTPLTVPDLGEERHVVTLRALNL